MMIPHSRPTLNRSDYRAVMDVLKSGLLTQGEQVVRFEKDLSSFIGVAGGVAVNSGTAALHLSLLSIGVGHGDEVIIPSYVCSALLNAVRYVDAVPVIADIEPRTFNIDADKIPQLLSKRTKAIIVPHMFGLPADMEKILAFGVPVIEDCAQSLGSRYKGKYVGSMGLLSIFSFYATKIIATGEGGMVLSGDSSLLAAIRDLRDYDEKDGYAVRYNYKMTDIQAALGISQLSKLPVFLKKRRRIADLYGRKIRARPEVQIPFVPEGREHIFYRYILLMDHPVTFNKEMLKRGIVCRRPIFKPLHRYLGLTDGYAATDRIWERAVSIPLYPSLKKGEIDEIVEGVHHSLQKA